MRITLRRGIGYVIQETGLFPHMTAERNVGMALEIGGGEGGDGDRGRAQGDADAGGAAEEIPGALSVAAERRTAAARVGLGAGAGDRSRRCC